MLVCQATGDLKYNSACYPKIKQVLIAVSIDTGVSDI
jgi:hypothetical protein